MCKRINQNNNENQTDWKKLLVVIFAIAMAGLLVSVGIRIHDREKLLDQQEALKLEKESVKEEPEDDETISCNAVSDVEKKPTVLPEYAKLYEENQDLIGWLSIEGTVIDYPVMQTPEDECYYLKRDFYGEDNENGCLIMDTDSVVGVGKADNCYQNGTSPSTNLIIHGHTMKSGEMFGDLPLYRDEEYGKAHETICFDSLYEHREYELIAVFYSQVYYQSQDVFKYYQFFQADTQEEFDDWYENIKKLSLYETGVTASFGDEFITLSCCSYHVEDGRFVVVAKRKTSKKPL